MSSNGLRVGYRLPQGKQNNRTQGCDHAHKEQTERNGDGSTLAVGNREGERSGRQTKCASRRKNAMHRIHAEALDDAHL